MLYKYTKKSTPLLHVYTHPMTAHAMTECLCIMSLLHFFSDVHFITHILIVEYISAVHFKL